ncbi:MAG: hypothetical protein HY926_15150 [Elusimicrobia bacterium]|nr:hypothetical protein [Elusimicrobiota bacterium]
MREARLLALVLVLSAPGIALAGAGDPELLPKFNRAAPSPRVSPEKAAPKAAASAPAEAEPREELPAVVRPPRKRPVFEDQEEHSRPKFVLRSRAWLTSGSLDTRFTFMVPPAQVTPAGLTVHLGETQEHRSDGLMLVNGAEVAPLPWLSFQAEYGQSRHSGSYRDRYWVDAKDANPLTYIPTDTKWYHPDHEDDLVAGADLDARRDWISGTLYLRAWDGIIGGTDYFKLRHSLDIGLGGQRYRQYSRMTKLVVLGNAGKYYQPALGAGAIAGYDSSYEGVFSGPHLALRDEVSGFYGFSMEALFVYSPIMSYRGTGHDNFQGALGTLGAMQQAVLLRPAAPNFKDSAGATAVHFAITGGWDWRWLRLEAGYQRLYFYTRTGSRRYYNADGTTTDVSLDFATAELGGIFGGASVRF